MSHKSNGPSVRLDLKRRRRRRKTAGGHLHAMRFVFLFTDQLLMPQAADCRLLSSTLLLIWQRLFEGKGGRACWLVRTWQFSLFAWFIYTIDLAFLSFPTLPPWQSLHFPPQSVTGFVAPQTRRHSHSSPPWQSMKSRWFDGWRYLGKYALLFPLGVAAFSFTSWSYAHRSMADVFDWAGCRKRIAPLFRWRSPCRPGGATAASA